MDKNITDKIKKLTEVLYRVTDLYSDKEPLKWLLRENAVLLYESLMSDMSNSAYGTDKINKNNKIIIKIIHLLEIASLGGFISDINFEILKKEYLSFKNLLEKAEQNLFSKAIMITQQSESAKSTENKKKNDKIYKGQKILSDKKTKNKIHQESEERNQKIIDFLKENGKKTIREIASVFGDVSAKTVQRNLAELIKSGKLLFEGEKRWRVYFLAKSPENTG